MHRRTRTQTHTFRHIPHNPNLPAHTPHPLPLPSLSLPLTHTYTHATHLDSLAQHTRQIIHPLPHQRHGVSLQVSHPELGQVGAEGHFGVVVAGLAAGEDGLVLAAHVGVEVLPVLPPAFAVARLDRELRREDVGELGTVAVPPPCHLCD